MLWLFTLLFTTVEAIYPAAWAKVGDISGRRLESLAHLRADALGIGLMFFLSGIFYRLLDQPWVRPKFI
jgi:hypothetical protein